MIRYWFEFDFGEKENVPYGTLIGCGVTAFDRQDALNMLREKIFGDKLPSILREIENVDISALDQGHVIPNMRAPNFRGIWFPSGYD